MILFLFLPLLLATGPALSMNPKGVHLALETSFLFDPSADRQYLPILKNIKKFINTLYTALSPKTSMRAKKIDNIEILTKFLKELSEIILQYEDDDIRHTVAVIMEEFDSYYENKKTVDDPMLFNPKFRMLVKNTLKEWMKTDVSKLKDKLKKFLNNIQNYGIVTKINKVFEEKDKKMLKRFVKDFKKYPKTQNIFKLTILVKELSRFVIFDRYDNLNQVAKTKLQRCVNKLFENDGADSKNISEDSLNENDKDNISEELNEVVEKLQKKYLKDTSIEDKNLNKTDVGEHIFGLGQLISNTFNSVRNFINNKT